MSGLLSQAGTIVPHLRSGNNKETFICLDYFHRLGLKCHISDLDIFKKPSYVRITITDWDYSATSQTWK